MTVPWGTGAAGSGAGPDWQHRAAGRPPGSRDPRSGTHRFTAFAIPFVWVADPDRQRRGIDLVVGLFEACERGGEAVVLTDGAGRVTAGPGGLTRQHRPAAR